MARRMPVRLVIPTQTWRRPLLDGGGGQRVASAAERLRLKLVRWDPRACRGSTLRFSDTPDIDDPLAHANRAALAEEGGGHAVVRAAQELLAAPIVNGRESVEVYAAEDSNDAVHAAQGRVE